MRVFVLEPTEYTMFKAKKFGTLVFLFGDESDHGAWHEEAFLSQLERAFRERDFDPENDYVAISGKMISVALMVAVAAKLYGEVRFLCFDHNSAVRDFREVDLARCPMS